METKKARTNGLDKFYTKKNISKKCINELDKQIKINKFDLVIEPSAGSEVFMLS